MGEELVQAMFSHKLVDFTVFGAKISITDSIVVMWLIMAFLVIFSVVITRNMKAVPSGKQHLAEMIVDFVNGIAKDTLGHYWRPFAAYLGTILLFLVTANIISVLNFIPDAEVLHKMTGLAFFEHLKLPVALRPPTRDISITASLAIMSIVIVLFAGIIIKRPLGWLKSFAHPSPVMVPFKILDYFVRPTSLCLRLFGNILGAFIVMELLYASARLLIPGAFSLYFDLFDGILQAYIFVFLTATYIAEAIE